MTVDDVVYETRAVWLGSVDGWVRLQIPGHGRRWLPQSQIREWTPDARGNGGTVEINNAYAERLELTGATPKRGLEGLPLGRMNDG